MESLRRVLLGSGLRHRDHAARRHRDPPDQGAAEDQGVHGCRPPPRDLPGRPQPQRRQRRRRGVLRLDAARSGGTGWNGWSAAPSCAPSWAGAAGSWCSSATTCRACSTSLPSSSTGSRPAGPGRGGGLTGVEQPGRQRGPGTRAGPLGPTPLTEELGEADIPEGELGGESAAGPMVGSFAATGSIQLIQAVVGVLLARILGPPDRGELAAVILWPTLITTIGSLGLAQSATYHASRASRLGPWSSAARWRSSRSTRCCSSRRLGDPSPRARRPRLGGRPRRAALS